MRKYLAPAHISVARVRIRQMTFLFQAARILAARWMSRKLFGAICAIVHAAICRPRPNTLFSRHLVPTVGAWRVLNARTTRTTDNVLMHTALVIHPKDQASP